MSMLSLAEIVRVLKQYRSRYRWLDVFASQVRELVEPSDRRFDKTGENQYRTKVGTDQLELLVYPQKGVIRCSLGTAENQPLPTATGAALGAMLGVAMRPRGPEGLILGLLLGGLFGAALGTTLQEPPNENRIMTLRYDPGTNRWDVYDGPYVQWAKEALRPG